MSADSFRDSFKTYEPKFIRKDQICVRAIGSKMDSLGVFDLSMTIRERKFLHSVAVMEDLKDNIISIDFMHGHIKSYDITSKQITFAHMLTNALYAIKEITILALLPMTISTKFKGTV
jgi:hypothetical protein